MATTKIVLLNEKSTKYQKILPCPMPLSCKNFRASRSCFPSVRTSLSSNFLGDFFPDVAMVEEKYFL